jgi:formate hydrogenlyase subunit 6/NADH:ubiquinone oxidoreductase subunit I
MEKSAASINEEECIRCGVCHDVCPSDAVRHDGELIPGEVKANLNWATSLLAHEYYVNDEAKQAQLLERLERNFAKRKKVAEKSLEQLEILKKQKFSD